MTPFAAIDAMRDDIRTAFASMHDALNSMLTRGKKVDELVRMSEELVRDSIVFAARAEIIKQRQLVARRHQEAVTRGRRIIAVISVAVMISIGYIASV